MPHTTGFILDTNVPSELTKPEVHPLVRAWVDEQDESLLHMSVITVCELRKGITILPPCRRRTRLENWLDVYLLPLFEDRILPVTRTIANRWGVMSGECELRGTPRSMADGLIAATALDRNLTLVTRNTKDFGGLGVKIFNPWAG